MLMSDAANNNEAFFQYSIKVFHQSTCWLALMVILARKGQLLLGIRP